MTNKLYIFTLFIFSFKTIRQNIKTGALNKNTSVMKLVQLNHECLIVISHYLWRHIQSYQE